MKKLLHNSLFTFILGALIFGIGGVLAEYIIFADNVVYSPENENWEVNNVQDALDELYTQYSNCSNLNTNLSTPRVIYTNNVAGPIVNTPYTFTEDVEYGIVVLSGANNTPDSTYLIAEITSLSSGTYARINQLVHSNSTYSFGNRTAIYEIRNVPKNAVINFRTRYGGLMQVLKYY